LTVSQRFEAFISNLKLTAPQRSDGETKFKSVTTCLNRHYYGSSSDADHSLLIGSWGKATQIRPARDVDIQFTLPASVKQRIEQLAWGTNRQSYLLQEVKSVLQRTFPNTVMRGDGQVVMVNFGSYAVEVAPAFAYGSQYLICNTRSGGSWMTVDPAAEISAINTADGASNGKVRDLVRMMKRWQANCSVPIKSFWIELLATEFLRTWEHRIQSSFYYDWMVRDFLSYLIRRADGSVIVPGIYEVISLGSDWKSRAQTAHDRACKACECEADKMPYTAGGEWQKIFGTDIPIS
jgi:hypothetical protein